MDAVDVAIIGAGAAGLAAARQLMAARLSIMVLEARGRIGGRAFTEHHGGYPLDLGCGWLHSADKNEWSGIAHELGFSVDKSAAPWGKRQIIGMDPAEAEDFRAASAAFFDRIDAAAHRAPDRPASELLAPGNRWNPLLNAMSTWISGVELDRLSLIDWTRYADTETNWRVTEGYGALIARFGAQVPVTLHCPVTTIDHGSTPIRLSTPGGTLTARAIIVAVPSAIIAEERLRFHPVLPEKVEAAAGLPLGLADKVFLAVDDAERLVPESRGFGDPFGPTGNFHIRPFRRPLIEAYFGGDLAESLESDTAGAFAIDQAVALLGNDFRGRLRPLVATAWRRDPFARGSYSYARPGHADQRAVLAHPVDDRLFFAGEATSTHDFSTAHGAYRTGVAAALALLRTFRR